MTDAATIAPVGRYLYAADPFHCDFAHRLFMSHLGNHVLNAAEYHASERHFGMDRLQHEQLTWVLSRLAIEMTDMPEPYTQFYVETWIESVMRLFVQRNFRIVGLDGRVYGYARSTWAMINMHDRRPADILAYDNGAIARWADATQQCPIAPCSRVNVAADAPLMRTVDTCYGDVDVNGHINSVKYLEHAINLFPLQWHAGHRLRRLEAAYVAESHGGDQLAFHCAETSPTERVMRIVKHPLDGQSAGEVCRCKLIFE